MLPVGYPYWTVIARKGRLADQVPLQYRHTPIERMLKKGRIGGKRSIERKFTQFALPMLQYAVFRRRAGEEVEVYRKDHPLKRPVRIHHWEMDLRRAIRGR